MSDAFATAELELRRRARQSYERSRLRSAMVRAWPPLAAGAGCFTLCGGSAWLCVAGLAIAVVSVALMHRGGRLGRAAWVGCLSGLPALLAAACVLEGLLGAGLAIPPVLPVAAAGVVAGAVLAFAARRELGRFSFLAAGSLLAVSTGAVGLAPLGLSAVVALAGAMLVTAAPIAGFARAPQPVRER